MRTSIILPFFLVILGAKCDNFAPEANAKLMLNLMKSLQEEKNQVFSPASLMKAINMLYYGMSDESRQIMNKNQEFFPQDFQTFMKDTKEVSIGNTPAKKEVNLITGDLRVKMKSKYHNEVKNSIKAETFKFDFQNKPEIGRKSLNAKIAKASNGLLKPFFDEGSITSDTKIVLANVLYFKSTWLEDFGEETYKKNFKLSDDSEIEVDFMGSDLEVVGYLQTSSGSQLVSLPFKDSDYEMIFVLPPENSKNLKEFAKNELEELLPIILNGDLDTTEAYIELPKFKIQTKSDMKNVLQTIEPFDHMFSQEASFSRLAQESVTVDQVIHMAVIDVNLKGVEAAAATGISFVPLSGFFPSVEVTFDRPFFYFIREKSTKMILFAGSVTNPAEK